MEERAGSRIRNKARGTGRALSETHYARGQYLSGGYRGSRGLLRFGNTFRKEHGQYPERGRRRGRRVPSLGSEKMNSQSADRPPDLAVDLGAESGRVIAGTLQGDRVVLEELHRFDNVPTRESTGLHWN